MPQRIIDRRRIVAAALGSHIEYQETVEEFTSWLVQFERSLNATTEVYMNDVEGALEGLKVGDGFIKLQIMIVIMSICST